MAGLDQDADLDIADAVGLQATAGSAKKQHFSDSDILVDDVGFRDFALRVSAITKGRKAACPLVQRGYGCPEPLRLAGETKRAIQRQQR
jgi:hypothetical protein